MKELRESAGISQRELARRLDIDPSHLSRLEAGHREPSVTLLRRMSEELSVPFGLLLAGVLMAELSDRERETYGRIIESLLELAKHRQLELNLPDQ